MAEPVTVWVATDASGQTCLFDTTRPKLHDGIWDRMYSEGQSFVEIDKGAFGLNVAPGECVEYVLIPVSEHCAAASSGDVAAKPQPVLSPVAELIARLATMLLCHRPYSTRDVFEDACTDAAKIVAAARKIEGGNHS